MATYVDGPVKTVTAGGTIAQFARVLIGSTGTATTAGVGDQADGTAERGATSGNPVPIRLRGASGTQKCIAAGAVTAGQVVYAAASGKVSATVNGLPYGRALEAATADNDVIEVRPFSSNVGTAIVERVRATTAQVNAGLVLLPAAAGVRYRVHDVALISIGGAASGATTVDITATQSASSVKLLAAAVAGLTQNTLLRAGATNATILAGGVSFVANDANTAVSIAKTGSDLATSTHIDVLITYSREN